MRLHVPQALEYLKDAGHEMSRAKYFRQKKKIEEMKLERMHHIAKVVYRDQHLERLDKVELVEKLMWENYNVEKDPTKKVKILSSIIEMQPFLSGYYEATKDILESTARLDKKFERSSNVPGLEDEVIPKSISNEPIVGFESEPWATEKDSKTEITSDKPKQEITNALTEHIETQETKENPIIDTSKKPDPEPLPEIQPDENNVVDIDILGRWPKPFDVDPWVQCKFNNSNCNKWFKTKEIRSKHIAKYHT